MYLRSIRYLSLQQLLSRLGMLTRRKLLHRVPAYTSRYRDARESSGVVTPVVYDLGHTHVHPQPELHEGTIELMNHRVPLGWPIDWAASGETQLWRYNLHYFEYAIALAQEHRASGSPKPYELFRDIVRQWLRSCPAVTPIAWDPYPLSLRIRNWIHAYQAFHGCLADDPDFARELRESLYGQARYLEDNVETHLSGNHLIENGRSLLLAGLFFQGDRPERWRHRGESLLWSGLEEQFLDDGAHYERSPMYHQMMLELYEEVVSVLAGRQESVPAMVTERVRSMRTWLGAVLHPDGEIPLLNDAAFGVAHSSAREMASQAPPDGLTALTESGYYVFRRRDTGDFLVFDAGPIGPEHQPGHGHCDTLSYELSVDGERVVVDSGVDDYYGSMEWRNYYRSTRAHNTIAIDSEEQSEIWSRFRVARRAQPLDVKWREDGDRLAFVVASHSGFQRLGKPVTHRRWIAWVDRCFWVVFDELSGPGAHHIESFVHFHPDARTLRAPHIGERDASGLVEVGGTRLTIAPFGAERLRLARGETDPIQGWYSPELGRAVPNEVWALEAEGGLPLRFGYVLWPRCENDIEVDSARLGDEAWRVDIRTREGTHRLRFDTDAVSIV